MRKNTYGGAASLDGYFARKNDAMDWLLRSDELRAVMSEYWGTIDTILMGRRTYEVSRQMGGGGQGGKVRTYVFSRTLPPTSDGSATIINDDAVDFVRNLKHEPGRDICLMGGGILAKCLLEADLIDEFGFNIHPGVARFGNSCRTTDEAASRPRDLEFPSFWKWVRSLDLQSQAKITGPRAV